MHKFLKIGGISVIVGVLVYVAAPLFLVSKKQWIEAVDSSNVLSPHAMTGALQKTAQTIEDTLNPQAKCHAPFHYALGTIDPRFHISRDAAKADVLKAEAIWEDAAQEDLMQYDDQADFKINFVFDERQQKTLEAKQLEQHLATVQTLQKGISQEYDALVSQYDTKKAQYESDGKKYQSLADEYTRQVNSWNAQGGAPDDQYQQLQNQKKTLDILGSERESQRKNLNTMIGQLNDLVKKEKKVVTGYNQDVTTYESLYGDGKAFDQGVYTGKEITIYQFSETNDLVLVLAHELGHALGMDHVENPKSIMYYLMAKQDVDHPLPSAEDMQAVTNRCL